jgi:multimeric flavodoxin WrbA
MKILAINGSHRGEKGYTQFLINKLFAGAARAHAECETVVLKSHKINPCIACRACHKPDHYLKCVFDEKDDVALIFDKMRQADVLVFATPVYIFHMTGLMKVFLDRITSTADSSVMTTSDTGLFFHHIDKELISKPFLLLTTQDNIEDETSKNIEGYFRTFSSFLDAPMAGVIRRKSGVLVGHGHDAQKELKYPVVQQIYRSIEQAGFELATHRRLSKKTESKCNLPVVSIPFPVSMLLKFKTFRHNKPFMAKILAKVKENAQNQH